MYGGQDRIGTVGGASARHIGWPLALQRSASVDGLQGDGTGVQHPRGFCRSDPLSTNSALVSSLRTAAGMARALLGTPGAGQRRFFEHPQTTKLLQAVGLAQAFDDLQDDSLMLELAGRLDTEADAREPPPPVAAPTISPLHARMCFAALQINAAAPTDRSTSREDKDKLTQWIVNKMLHVRKPTASELHKIALTEPLDFYVPASVTAFSRRVEAVKKSLHVGASAETQKDVLNYARGLVRKGGTEQNAVSALTHRHPHTNIHPDVFKSICRTSLWARSEGIASAQISPALLIARADEKEKPAVEVFFTKDETFVKGAGHIKLPPNATLSRTPISISADAAEHTEGRDVDDASVSLPQGRGFDQIIEASTKRSWAGNVDPIDESAEHVDPKRFAAMPSFPASEALPTQGSLTVTPQATLALPTDLQPNAPDSVAASDVPLPVAASNASGEIGNPLLQPST